MSRHLRASVLALAVAACTALVAVPAAAADEEFTVTARYSGLYPGADTAVPVTVENPFAYDLAVESAAVVVGDASAGCPAANVVAHSFAGRVTVPARSRADLPIRMQMPATAPDACQGATFPLTFHATGAPASGAPASGAPGDDPGAGGFAFTGAAPAGLVLAGVGALAGGAALVALGWRRRAGAVGR
jgi:hypothetical protein